MKLLDIAGIYKHTYLSCSLIPKDKRPKSRPSSGDYMPCILQACCTCTWLLVNTWPVFDYMRENGTFSPDPVLLSLAWLSTYIGWDLVRRHLTPWLYSWQVQSSSSWLRVQRIFILFTHWGETAKCSGFMQAAVPWLYVVLHAWSTWNWLPVCWSVTSGQRRNLTKTGGGAVSAPPDPRVCDAVYDKRGKKKVTNFTAFQIGTPHHFFLQHAFFL